MVKIVGGGSDGSDLLLPANLTDSADLVEVAALEGGPPLPAGPFVVQLSLNGEDFSGGPDDSQQV